tara:strand:+ start:1464 stop:2819 length:1356 start_codon:yes stop_codon:yes gene_type:complete
MDISKFKFVVSTGCSYGVVHESFRPNADRHHAAPEQGKDWELIEKFKIDGDVISISLGVSSQGAKWQSDSIIYTTKKLLELGVKPENIYCFVEWSEWDRGTTTIPATLIDRTRNLRRLKKERFTQEQDIFLLSKSTDSYHIRDTENPNEFQEVLNYLNDNIEIGRIDCKQTIGVIGETLYVTASQIPWHVKDWGLKLEDDGGVNLDFEELLEIQTHLSVVLEEIAKKEKSFSIEELLDTYIGYIYQTQCFFKENKIDYNFTSINTQLTGFFRTSTGNFNWERDNTEVAEIGEDGNVKLKDNPSAYISKSNDIENIVKQVSWKVQLLDLDKFNFHNSDRFRRGGIDNYLLDYLGEGVFTRPYNSYNAQQGHDVEDVTSHSVDRIVLGMHPHEVLYCFVWDRFAKDCKFLQFSEEYLESVYNKYREDYDSDTVSPNGITISKLYLNKWQNKLL